ncbi:unnamed protein product [Laminaria digitata]
MLHSYSRVCWEYLRVFSTASTRSISSANGRNTANPGSTRNAEPQTTASAVSIHSRVVVVVVVLTLTHRQNQVRGHKKVLEPQEDPKKPIKIKIGLGSTMRSHLKTHETKKAHT